MMQRIVRDGCSLSVGYNARNAVAVQARCRCDAVAWRATAQASIGVTGEVAVAACGFACAG